MLQLFFFVSDKHYNARQATQKLIVLRLTSIHGSALMLFS